jgi:hypothetical protein
MHLGVGVEARHLCMMMRGVEKQQSSTITSAMLGAFREKETLDEFLALIHGRHRSYGAILVFARTSRSTCIRSN